MSDAKCSIGGCDRNLLARKMCKMHYERWRRHGDPLVVLKAVSARGAPTRWITDHVSHVGPDCLIWPFARFPDGRAHMHGAKPSRVMCELAHGAPPTPRHEAAHSCGRGHDACVNPAHLRWATSLENSSDKVLHGTILQGEDHPGAKLTAADIVDIRSLAKRVQQKDIAVKFGVADSCISKIVNRKAWGSIP